jgi:parallel beta-helix repeat protein
MLDIRDFGIADPTGVQDSTSALQNAINAAANAVANVPNLTTSTDSTVFVPTGTFKITAQITIPNTGGTQPHQNPVRIAGSAAGGSVLNMTGGFVKSYTGVNSATIQPYDNGVLRAAPTVYVQTPGSLTAVTYIILYTYFNTSIESFASQFAILTMPPDSTFVVTGINAPPTPYTGINVYASYVSNLATGVRSSGKIATTAPVTLTGMPTLTVGGAFPPSLTIPTQTFPAVGFQQSDVGSFVVGPGIPSGTVIYAYLSATNVLLSGTPLLNSSTVPITINIPKIVTQGFGDLTLEHLQLQDVNGSDAAAPAPFILTTKSALRASHVSFTGANNAGADNHISFGGVTTTQGSANVTFSGSTPVLPLGSTVFCILPSSDLIPPDTFVIATSYVGGTTTVTLSQPAAASATGVNLLVFYSFHDAIIFGGTGEVQDGSANGAFAGYGSLIEKCSFSFIRRAVMFRSAANAVVFRDNSISYGCAAGFSWEAAIDVDGGAGGCGSNLIEGNIVELNWYRTGIRLFAAYSNALVGNYLSDSGDTPHTDTYLVSQYAWWNTIIGGACDSGPNDQTVASIYGPRNTIIVGDRKLFFNPALVSNLTLFGANQSLFALGVPVVSVTGGGGATSYSYRVSAVNPQGETVTAQAQFNGVLSLSGNNFNLLTIQPVVGATSYKIYGRFPGTEQYMATVQATGQPVTWSDFGVITPSGALPSAPVGTKIAVRSWASQVGNLQEWQNSGGVVMAAVDANGNVNRYGTNDSSLALAVPAGVTVTAQGSTGATVYSYRVSAVNAEGQTLACASVPISNGNALLTGTNYNLVTIPNVNGAASYNVYGRTSGSEQFMINLPATGGTVTWADTGTITPSGAPPTSTTGTKVVVQAWQAQSGDLQQWQSSTGAVLARVDASGNATFANLVAAYVTADVVFSNTTLGNIAGLSFAIPASQTWTFEAYLEVVSASTNGGVIAITIPTGASVLMMIDGPSSSFNTYQQSIVVGAAPTRSATFLAAGTTGFVTIRGFVQNSTSAGTVQLQAASATNTNNFTVKANSYMTARKSA